MSALLILIVAVVLLALGYVFYGSWLAKQWGVDPNRETPAHTSYDGKDFVPANPAVLMGHHFSSIAGAGPINGPIQAAVFGWVPVFLWCASVHRFRTGSSDPGHRLLHGGCRRYLRVGGSGCCHLCGQRLHGHDLHPVHRHRCDLRFLCVPQERQDRVFIGQEVGLHFSRTFWVLFIAVYVTVASLLPVWILLQPRDYLSSFLLYGMMIIAIISIVGGSFTGAATVEAPAFYGWKNPAGQPLFPFLFITVACGACSGFHSLISSGTSSKQINNEKDAQIIGYGSMIIESALGVISLIAIGVVWSQSSAGGGDKFLLSAPPTIFAGGIATMFASFAGEKSYSTIYNLFTLAVSVFALTSLDSATRLCRYLFGELLTPEGKTHDDLTGAAKFFSTPIVSTLIMVIIGCGMGFMGLSQIWSVFGAANQLLASIAMLAVCTWLGKIGKNNKMFYFPMVFMLCATITALCFTIINGFKTIAAGAQWGTYFQVIWSIVLVILAVILAVTAFKTLGEQGKKKA